MNPRSLLIGSAVGLVLVASANPLLAQSSTETYTYDALGRLIAVVTSGGQNNGETHSICYDDAGNRTQYASDVSGIPATCTGAPPPPANLAIGNATVTEGATLSFVVTRSGNTAIAASASYATVNGTAFAPGDYTTTTGTVSFAAGETSKTITVTTIDDTAVESSEAMSVTLSGPSANTAITTASGTGTINDNDVAPAPSIAVSNASSTEGNAMSFNVTLSAAYTSSISVNYATAYGTAGSSDFTARSGTLTFAAGETAKPVSVATTHDLLIELTESFTLNLSGATGGATIADSQGVGSIIDDDEEPNPCWPNICE